MATGGVADMSGMSTLDRRQLRTVRETIRLAVPLLGVWGVGLIVMAWVATQTEERAMFIEATLTATASGRPRVAHSRNDD